MKKKALVLFSGGLDSTTALYWALDRSENVIALTFDYGQRHGIEIKSAEKITRMIGMQHEIMKIDLTQVGGSSLTDLAVPLDEFPDVSAIPDGIPATYVPFRNGIFLSLAAACADVQECDAIVCGFHTLDSPNYPDTREGFVRAMEAAIFQGTRSGESGKKIDILSPFSGLKKSEIIKLGLELDADYSYSLSCYAGAEIPCQRCSSCLLREQAWEEIGIKDHLLARLEREGIK